MWVYLFCFVLATMLGFLYGKKAHLKQLSGVLLRQGMPLEQVDRLCEVVRTYNKIARQAKKETREAYKKMLVDGQLEKLKKEVDKNG